MTRVCAECGRTVYPNAEGHTHGVTGPSVTGSSLDKDLATLRRPHVAMYADRKAAADRVEDELSRLREERHEVGRDAIHYKALLFEQYAATEAAEAENTRLRGLIEGSATDEAILQAAEARCAQLQQALREVDRHLTSTGGSLSPRHADHWRAREAARAALAGPDMPADSQPETLMDWYIARSKESPEEST